MKHLLLIIFLSVSFSGNSQSTHKIDSLKRVLAGFPSRNNFSNDTLRVRVLCALGEQFNNPDSTIKYAGQAKSIATQRNWVDGEFESGFLYGKGLYRKNLYYQALDVYFGLLIICEKNHFRKREAIVLRAIGDSYLSVSNFILAKKNYNNSMNIFKELKEYEEFADTQNNLAVAYLDNNKSQDAIRLLLNCLTYLPYIKGNWSEISFYGNLCKGYENLNQYDKALIYSKKTINRINLLSKNDINENSLYWKASALVRMGELYTKLGRYKDAQNSADLAKKLLPNNGVSNLSLNELYYKIFKRDRNYKKSLYYLELFKESEDSKTKLDQNQILSTLKSVYNLTKEEEKVLLLNTNLERENLQKKIGWVGLVVISAFLILAYWSFINQKKKSKQIEEQKSAIEELNNSLEIKVRLRTQELSEANDELVKKNQEISEALYKGQSIERTRVASALHDNLGGAMAAVKWMLESIDTNNLSEDDRKVYENALNITSETYSDVRFMSHNFIPEVLAQLGLQGTVKKLCQEISQTKRMEMDFEDKTFSEFAHQIELEIYSICLELTTNILKHSKATKAKILMQETETALQIIVSDNGVGFSNEDINGKGLKNIRKRLEAIKGVVEIKSILNETSCFTLIIPLAMREEYMNLQAENPKIHYIT